MRYLLAAFDLSEFLSREARLDFKFEQPFTGSEVRLPAEPRDGNARLLARVIEPDEWLHSAYEKRGLGVARQEQDLRREAARLGAARPEFSRI